MNSIEKNMRMYLKERPALLAVLRSKEAFIFQQLLPFKKPVLDIGCGDGFFASIVLGRNQRRPKAKPYAIDVGLDVEGSRIDQADRTGVYKKTVTYDGKTMPFANNSFSTIISNSTLEHIEYLPQVVREAHRVLKPKGKFFTTVIAKPWADHYFGNKFLGAWYKKWMTQKQIHTNLLTHHQWEDLFKKAGFKIDKKVGHVGPSVSTWTDILHYCGIGNLMSYTLFGTWVLFPAVAQYLFPTHYFSRLVSPDCSPDTAVALFFELTKK